MSERLIKYWGKNSEEAFGKPGKIGDQGEAFFVEVYKNKDWFVQHKSNFSHQTTGVDVILINKETKVEHTIDVKNNLKVDGIFYVDTDEDGWLFNKKYKNEFVSHVNPETGIIATYKREKMKEYVLANYPDWHKKLLCLNIQKVPFIKIQKYEKENHTQTDIFLDLINTKKLGK